MSSVTALSEILCRELDDEEKELMGCLSAQGMAKINTDVSKGVDLEQTVAELKSVFRCMKRRREKIANSLPESAQSILSRMTRPPTADEMILLQEVPPVVLLNKVNALLHEGNELNDIIEDLAVTHRQQQLLFDAQELAAAQGCSVSISRLVPTQCVVNDDPYAVNTMKIRSNRMHIGLSPIVLWFADHLEQDSESPRVIIGSPDFSVGSYNSGSSGTPRSALKGSRPNSFTVQNSSSSFHSLDAMSDVERAVVSFAPCDATPDRENREIPLPSPKLSTPPRHFARQRKSRSGMPKPLSPSEHKTPTGWYSKLKDAFKTMIPPSVRTQESH